jgi:hypothetical protein
VDAPRVVGPSIGSLVGAVPVNSTSPILGEEAEECSPCCWLEQEGVPWEPRRYDHQLFRPDRGSVHRSCVGRGVIAALHCPFPAMKSFGSCICRSTVRVMSYDMRPRSARCGAPSSTTPARSTPGRDAANRAA